MPYFDTSCNVDVGGSGVKAAAFYEYGAYIGRIGQAASQYYCKKDMDGKCPMEKETFQRLERMYDEYHVILEIPFQPENEDAVRREIKEILSEALPFYPQEGRR